jgi:hypothetical protein
LLQEKAEKRAAWAQAQEQAKQAHMLALQQAKEERERARQQAAEEKQAQRAALAQARLLNSENQAREKEQKKLEEAAKKSLMARLQERKKAQRKTWGATSGELLSAFIRVFSQRPDIRVTVSELGPAVAVEQIIGLDAHRTLDHLVLLSEIGPVAWHWGATDATGFAAMGVAEVLLHTHDITKGLGIAWEPPESLAQLVLAQLLPDAPPGRAPDVLRWATGRGELVGHAPVDDWVWRPMGRSGGSQRASP